MSEAINNLTFNEINTNRDSDLIWIQKYFVYWTEKNTWTLLLIYLFIHTNFYTPTHVNHQKGRSGVYKKSLVIFLVGGKPLSGWHVFVVPIALQNNVTDPGMDIKISYFKFTLFYRGRSHTTKEYLWIK